MSRRRHRRYVALAIGSLLASPLTCFADERGFLPARKIESDVLYALLTHPAMEPGEVTVAAGVKGDVVLRGEVDSRAERHIAEQIARSIAGVRSVSNSIMVVADPLRSAGEITEDIQYLAQGNRSAHRGLDRHGQ